ncbi:MULTISPECIES: AraC family transcriptional regulator [Paenibacillus]|uniref:Helix-turn-helix transcriptional regulator n=1 Tax=Paenibacillus oceani TaxID=2772510 RepID=A0A927H288_9BACL|nr:AraC family transcriptional regulator [Paenibacillus oceani]MBD2865565.1 helix-turn-helix transcriptional regulator [Paenibacillus oceani]
MEYAVTLSDHQYLKDKREFMLRCAANPAWTLMAVEHGRFEYRIQGARGEAGTGDIVVCPPYLDFHRKTLTPLTFHYIKCNWTAPNANRHLELQDRLHDLFAYKVTIGDSDRLRSNYSCLQEAAGRLSEPERAWKNHLVNDLWLQIERESNRLSRISGIRDKLMLEAKEWLELHLDKESSIADAASRFHLHPVHFARRFRSCFGVTPSRYVTECRIEKAKRLLCQSDYTIDHIAQLCGYDNGFYFSRIFTKETGTNPSEYRKRHAPRYP